MLQCKRYKQGSTRKGISFAAEGNATRHDEKCHPHGTRTRSLLTANTAMATKSETLPPAVAATLLLRRRRLASMRAWTRPSWSSTALSSSKAARRLPSTVHQWFVSNYPSPSPGVTPLMTVLCSFGKKKMKKERSEFWNVAHLTVTPTTQGGTYDYTHHPGG